MSEEKITPMHPDKSEAAGQVKKLFRNRDVLKWVIIGLAGFVVLVLVFGAGVKVGTFKARYSYRWADNYHKNFAGPRGGFLGDWQKFPAGDFISGHGAFGEIIEMSGDGFVMRGRENAEKIVVINDATTILRGREKYTGGLSVGDRVVVIGSPNDRGQIEAKLIRIFIDGAPALPLMHRDMRLFF